MFGLEITIAELKKMIIMRKIVTKYSLLKVLELAGKLIEENEGGQSLPRTTILDF